MKRCLLLLILSPVAAVAQFTSTAQYIVTGTALPALCTPNTGQVFVLFSGGTSTPYYCKTSNSWATMGGGSIAATWGSITGTLSSQSDLNTALNARLVATNNLSDVGSAATSRTNLGLGTGSTQNTGTSGANLCLLNANCTFSGTETFSSTVNMSGLTASGILALDGSKNIITPASPLCSTYFPACGSVTTSASPASPQLAKFSSATAITTATAHDIDNVPLACNDSSGSGTVQSCSTAPTFAPASGDTITYKTTTTNTGTLTLNVNGSGAAAVQKWLGSALVAGDVIANKPVKMTFDGTNWQLMTIGNAPAGFALTSSDTSLSLTNCVSGPTCNLVVGSTVTTPAFSATITCAFGTPAYTCRPAALTGSTTLTATGTVAGKVYVLVWVHDNTSNTYSVTYPANFINFPNIWNEAQAEIEIPFTCDATPNCHPLSSYLGVGNVGFGYAPERSDITTTASAFGAFTFSSASHTLVYYANNISNRHAMPRVASGDQIVASDCTNCAAVVAISSSAAALNTAAISSGACATTVTVSATGVGTGNRIVYTPTANPQGVTGYAVSASGSLYIWAYPTANNVNFQVCNNTASSITPGALSLNWVVF